MTDMTHGIGGCARVTAAVRGAHVGNVDVADDVVVDGHILSYNIPETCVKQDKLATLHLRLIHGVPK